MPNASPYDGSVATIAIARNEPMFASILHGVAGMDQATVVADLLRRASGLHSPKHVAIELNQWQELKVNKVRRSHSANS